MLPQQELFGMTYILLCAPSNQIHMSTLLKILFSIHIRVSYISAPPAKCRIATVFESVHKNLSWIKIGPYTHPSCLKKMPQREFYRFKQLVVYVFRMKMALQQNGCRHDKYCCLTAFSTLRICGGNSGPADPYFHSKFYSLIQSNQGL